MQSILEKLGIAEENHGVFCGDWRGGGGRIDKISPIDGRRLASVRTASDEDYKRAITRAQEAFFKWRVTPAPVRAFDLDLSQLAYDLTSVAFCGAYEDAAELVRFGYSRDHRPDRKQLELATTVTLAGGVPIDYRVLAGNVADRTTPVENLRRLRLP